MARPPHEMTESRATRMRTKVRKSIRRGWRRVVRRVLGGADWRYKLAVRGWRARLGRHDVIYVITAGSDENLGFCGHILYALNGVRIAEGRGWIPVVNFDDRIRNHFLDPAFGDNIWDYYFEPVAGLTYADIRRLIERGIVRRSQLFSLGGGDLKRIHLFDPDRVAHFWSQSRPADAEGWMRQKRALGRRLTQTYIRVKPHILAKAATFAAARMDGAYVIGAHIRGTDFAYADATPLTDYFAAIDRMLATRPDARIFVATDQLQILAQIEARYPGRVFATDCTRSDNDVAPFQLPELSPYLRGEEMLIDCLLLARCNHLIKGAAAAGEVALYFNPDLECTDFALTSYARPLKVRKTAFETLELSKVDPA
jgi:hypothetical protein